MFQPDLFSPVEVAEDLNLPALLDRLAEVLPRPRYTFMVLNLIATAAGSSDSVGPQHEGAKLGQNGRSRQFTFLAAPAQSRSFVRPSPSLKPDSLRGYDPAYRLFR